jgi:tetratricopeptide (TPR) repeat protein
MYRRLGIIVLCLLSLSGITGCLPNQVNTSQDTTIDAQRTQPYVTQAKQYEAQGDIRKAIAQLKTARQILQSDMVRLEQKAQNLAEQKYQSGLKLEKAGDTKGAHKEFLSALRYSPGHAGALSRLKKQKSPVLKHQTYTIQKGDSLSLISRKFYNTPDDYKIIASYNNIDVTAPLMPGNKLKIPQFNKAAAKKPFNRTHTLRVANARLKKGQYQIAIEHAQIMLKHNRTDADAHAIINQARFEIGKKLAARGQNKKALKQFSKVAPGFNGIDKEIHALKIRMKKENAALYRRARSLAAKNRLREALETYKKADPDYSDVRRQIENLETTIKDLSASHYNKGIAYYVREDLVHAIEEWEAVLELDPNHEKARKDIESARSLLKKVKQHQ